jgi:hypothetical protein
VVISGDPAKPGPYALEIHVPPNTMIAPHTHHDDRFATVISGVWYFDYGAQPGNAPMKTLTTGGFYTEPAVVRLNGMGPSDTTYVAATASK